MAADAAVDGHVDDLLLAVKVDPPLVEAEPRQPDDALERLPVGGRADLRRVALVDIRCRRVVDRRVLRRGVVEVDPVVPPPAEPGVECDALQALLVVLVHVDGGRDRVESVPGVVVPDLTAAGGVQHAAIGQHREVHRFARLIVQGDLLEVGVRRGAARDRRHGGQSTQDHGNSGHDGCSTHGVPTPRKVASSTSTTCAAGPEVRGCGRRSGGASGGDPHHF